MLQLVLATESDTLGLGLFCAGVARSSSNKQLVIGLEGTLGVGKTTFTRGLAQGLGIEEPVCSPTFTMLNEYVSGDLPLYHFDLYRMSEGIADFTGHELAAEIAELLCGPGVFVVEWVDLQSELIAAVEDLRLHFCYREDGGRQVTLHEKRRKGLPQQISDHMTAVGKSERDGM